MKRSFDIDWSKSATRMIDASAPGLPHNMAVIVADAFDRDVLRRAVAMFDQSEVQMVQIETPYDAELVAAARCIEKADGEDVVFETAATLPDDLAVYFSGFADVPNVDRLENNMTGMAKAIIDEYGPDAMNEFVIIRADAVNYSFYSFHAHVIEDFATPPDGRAFYLLRPMSDVNTVFADCTELAPQSRKRNAEEALFIVDHPTLWRAKPGAYTLFANKGHAQGPAFHASPINQVSRTIANANFFIR